MKPALAKTPEPNALEDLGRATVQIVHDLKNQLNGLKLYATFLRKRLERDDRAIEERETLEKLIAGLDRSARDMTALVQYARPIELHRQARTDLKEILSSAVGEVARRITGPLIEPITCNIEPGALHGEFDPIALTESLAALTLEAYGTTPKNDFNTSIHVSSTRTNATTEAFIEWRGVKSRNRSRDSQSTGLDENIHVILAARVIAAHDGRIQFDKDVIRVWLPLSN